MTYISFCEFILKSVLGGFSKPRIAWCPINYNVPLIIFLVSSSPRTSSNLNHNKRLENTLAHQPRWLIEPSNTHILFFFYISRHKRKVQNFLPCKTNHQGRCDMGGSAGITYDDVLINHHPTRLPNHLNPDTNTLTPIEVRVLNLIGSYVDCWGLMKKDRNMITVSKMRTNRD